MASAIAPGSHLHHCDGIFGSVLDDIGVVFGAKAHLKVPKK